MTRPAVSSALLLLFINGIAVQISGKPGPPCRGNKEICNHEVSVARFFPSDYNE